MKEAAIRTLEVRLDNFALRKLFCTWGKEKVKDYLREKVRQGQFSLASVIMVEWRKRAAIDAGSHREISTTDYHKGYVNGKMTCYKKVYYRKGK